MEQDARQKLKELYGLESEDEEIPASVRKILSWLDRYPDLVKLEWRDHHVFLSYHLKELTSREPQDCMANVERSFKHLKPYCPRCIQTTHGRQLWKIWMFVKATKAKEPRVVNSKPKKRGRKSKREVRGEGVRGGDGGDSDESYVPPDKHVKHAGEEEIMPIQSPLVQLNETFPLKMSTDSMLFPSLAGII